MVKPVEQQIADEFGAAREELNQQFRNALTEAMDTAIDRSPERTGTFVGSLQVSSDNSFPNRSAGQVKGKSAAKQAIRNDIASLDPTRSAFVKISSSDIPEKVKVIDERHGIGQGIATVFEAKIDGPTS